MNKAEYEVQKALGLMHEWDVFARFQKDSFYTVYEVEAPTKDIALALGYEIILKQGCKISRQVNGTFAIFVEARCLKRMEGSKVAKKPY